MKTSRILTIALLTVGLTVGTAVQAQSSQKGFESIEKGDLPQLFHFVKEFHVEYRHPKTQTTPLVYAISKGQDQSALYLMSVGADVNNQSNNFSPLYWAVYYNRLPIVAKMLEKGAVFSNEKERSLAMSKVDMKNHTEMKTLLTSN